MTDEQQIRQAERQRILEQVRGMMETYITPVDGIDRTEKLDGYHCGCEQDRVFNKNQALSEVEKILTKPDEAN